VTMMIRHTALVMLLSLCNACAQSGEPQHSSSIPESEVSTPPNGSSFTVGGSLTIDGAPTDDATISLRRILPGVGVDPTSTVRIAPDAGGKFRSPLLASGVWEVRAEGPFESVVKWLPVFSESNDCKLEAHRGFSLSGKLRSSSAPVGGVVVIATSRVTGVPRVSSRASAEDGFFTVGGLSHGVYSLQMETAEGLVLAENVDVEIDGASVDGMTFDVGDAGNVDVSIEPAGSGLLYVLQLPDTKRGHSGDLVTPTEAIYPFDTGRVSMPVVPLGEYSLIALTSDGKRAMRTLRVEQPGKLDVALTLQQEATLTGTIEAQDGSDVGARYAVLQTEGFAYRGEDEILPFAASRRANSLDGVVQVAAVTGRRQFSLSVPSGRYHVEVVDERGTPIAIQDPKENAIKDEEVGRDFRVKRSMYWTRVTDSDPSVVMVDGNVEAQLFGSPCQMTIAGEVRDGRGHPVPNAELWLVQKDVDRGRVPPSADGLGRRGYADSEGRFAFPGVCDMEYLVGALANDEGPIGGVTVVGDPASARSTVVSVGPYGAIELDVRQNGEPVATYAVTLEAKDKTTRQLAVVNGAGKHRIDWLVDGAYRVLVSSGAYYAIGSASVEKGNVVNVTLDLRNAGSLTGRLVTESGAPVTGVNVSLGLTRERWPAPEQCEFACRYRRDATTDEEGRFRIDNVIPGKVDLVFRSPKDELLTVREKRVVPFGTIEQYLNYLRVDLEIPGEGFDLGEVRVRRDSVR